MSDSELKSILTVLNNAQVSAKQPAIYQAIKSLITATHQNRESVVVNNQYIQSQLSGSLIYGTALDRTNYKPKNTAGNLIFFFETDTGTLWLYTTAWFEVTAVVSNASYITATDETATLPNSRKLEPGQNVFLYEALSGKAIVGTEMHPFSFSVMV